LNRLGDRKIGNGPRAWGGELHFRIVSGSACCDDAGRMETGLRNAAAGRRCAWGADPLGDGCGSGEQNHNSGVLKGSVRRVDFLRKSTLYCRGLGYTYRDSAVSRAARQRMGSRRVDPMLSSRKERLQSIAWRTHRCCFSRRVVASHVCPQSGLVNRIKRVRLEGFSHE